MADPFSGPWKVGLINGDPVFSSSVFVETHLWPETLVCSVTGYFDHPEREKVAHMISAAPEMLKALRAAVAGWNEALEDGDPYPDWLAPARAAIAKAEGVS